MRSSDDPRVACNAIAYTECFHMLSVQSDATYITLVSYAEDHSVIVTGRRCLIQAGSLIQPYPWWPIPIRVLIDTVTRGQLTPLTSAGGPTFSIASIMTIEFPRMTWLHVSIASRRGAAKTHDHAERHLFTAILLLCRVLQDHVEKDVEAAHRSHHLAFAVELHKHPLVEVLRTRQQARSENGDLDAASPDAPS
jgi:hypothetical protein